MNSIDAVGFSALGAFLMALITACLKFSFDFIRDRMGWAREDSRGLKLKLEDGDSQARAEILRVERELGKVEKQLAERLNATDRKLGRLEEKVGHLPTANDIKAMTSEISEARRETARLAATLEGQALTLTTIMDYLLSKERGS